MEPWTNFAWADCQVIGAPVDNAHNNVIYVNSTTTFRNPSIPIPINQWVTIDLANGPQCCGGSRTCRRT
jgi:hypothetical protein